MHHVDFLPFLQGINLFFLFAFLHTRPFKKNWVWEGGGGCGGGVYLKRKEFIPKGSCVKTKENETCARLGIPMLS